MAVESPPAWLENGTYTSVLDRTVIDALTGGRGGVIAKGMQVTEKSGTPNMSVDVAAGWVIIPGTEASTQGSYICRANTTTNLAIATSDGTHARKDLVVARVKDAFYSGASNTFTVEVITGTPAASPVVPTLPNNSWALAIVTVPAASSSVVNANISDQRVATTTYGQAGWGVAVGGVVPTAGGVDADSPMYGMVAYDVDNNELRGYNGSAWVSLSWRWVPVQARCSSQLATSSGTYADITGATLTITTVRANQVAYVFASFEINNPGVNVAEGCLNVDGSVQTGTVSNNIASSEQTPYTAAWVITLAAAGSHTLKLQGKRAGGAGTVTFAATNTYIAIPVVV